MGPSQYFANDFVFIGSYVNYRQRNVKCLKVLKNGHFFNIIAKFHLHEIDLHAKQHTTLLKIEKFRISIFINFSIITKINFKLEIGRPVDSRCE